MILVHLAAKSCKHSEIFNVLYFIKDLELMSSWKEHFIIYFSVQHVSRTWHSCFYESMSSCWIYLAVPVYTASVFRLSTCFSSLYVLLNNNLSRPHHTVYRYEVIDTPSDIFVIMEYVQGGELFDFIVSRGRLPPDEARQFFHQVQYVT